MEIDTITTIGRIISQPFLGLTFLRYWYATKFRYLYRICFMNYLILLMISNFWNVWAISKMYHLERPKHIFHTYNFIELSILLWTNVLCFDFWRSIKTLRPYNDEREDRIIFIKCLMYVWISSILYTIVGCVNDYLVARDSHIYCTLTWISFTFTLILLLSNVFMVVHATTLIINEVRAIKKITLSVTIRNENDHKKKLLLYCKLFVVAIFLLASKWLWFNLNNMFKKKEFLTIFELLMVLNSFQGIFIFMLFALKKKYIMTFKTSVYILLNKQTTSCELSASEMATNSEITK